MATRYLIALALLCVSMLASPVHAGSIQLHLASKHAGHHPQLNERNWGFGWTGDGAIAPTAGYYTNSWFLDSFYAGVHFRYSSHWSTSFLGVTGYKGTSQQNDHMLIGGEIMPMPLLHFIPWPNHRISPMLSYAPTQDGGVVLLSVNINL